jgi:acetylglutamate kinase
MTVVIKYGGSAMTDTSQRQAVAEAIRQSAHEGLQPVVVHGGGPFIEQALQQAGLERRFVRGLRVTSSESLTHIERVLTLLGKKLAHEIGGALGLTGRDAGLLFAEEFDASLGRVGRMVSVNARLLEQLLAIPVTPVIACLAAAGDGGLLNVNADEVAGAVAGALNAPVVFLTDVPGVLDDPADPFSLLPRLTRADAEARIADGRIAGGMIPKVEAALRALDEGAPSALIADGQDRDSFTAALRGTAGTRILGP